jgi:hypothetical protein
MHRVHVISIVGAEKAILHPDDFSTPLNSHRSQKRLIRAYQNLFSSVHTEALAPHKIQYIKDRNYVLL